MRWKESNPWNPLESDFLLSQPPHPWNQIKHRLSLQQKVVYRFIELIKSSTHALTVGIFLKATKDPPTRTTVSQPLMKGNFSFCTLYRWLYTIHACWKQCFSAPTGIMCIWTMNFFSAPTAEPPTMKSVRQFHYVSRKKNIFSRSRTFLCFLFSWVWKFVRKSVDFGCRFWFHVVSFRFSFYPFCNRNKGITSAANCSTGETYCF